MEIELNPHHITHLSDSNRGKALLYPLPRPVTPHINVYYRYCARYCTVYTKAILIEFIKQKQKRNQTLFAASRKYPPFTLSTITSKVVVYAPAERAFLLLLFSYVVYLHSAVLLFKQLEELEAAKFIPKRSS